MQVKGHHIQIASFWKELLLLLCRMAKPTTSVKLLLFFYFSASQQSSLHKDYSDFLCLTQRSAETLA